eukprot:UN26485
MNLFTLISRSFSSSGIAFIALFSQSFNSTFPCFTVSGMTSVFKVFPCGKKLIHLSKFVSKKFSLASFFSWSV